MGVLRRRGCWRSVAECAAVGLALVSAAGCHVVSIEQDREARERRSGSFDAESHIAKIWQTRVVPDLEKRAVDASALITAERGRFNDFAHQHGRQAGEGSPWTFVVRGEGKITAIDAGSRRGTMTVALADGTPVTMQLGPVIVDSALRDALPIFDFNDFSDQMAYAAVSRALTARALAEPTVAVGKLPLGARVRFLGVAQVDDPAAPLQALPVRLEGAN